MALLANRATPETAPHAHARVAELQAQINGMQASGPPSRSLPTRADVALLLPGGLREGGVYQVRGSTSLMTIALAEASAAGRWTAWVGLPRLGAEALANAGVRLDRTALVPNPGTHWLSVVSSLADAMSVLAVRPPRGARVAPGDAARLSARLRERGATLLIDGDWAAADAELRVDDTVWHGLGQGHGVLLDRQLRVSVRDRSGRVRRGPVGVNAPLARTLRAVAPSASVPAAVPTEVRAGAAESFVAEWAASA